MEKNIFTEPEIEVVTFESLDQICADAGIGGPDVGSPPGGDIFDDEFDFGF